MNTRGVVRLLGRVLFFGCVSVVSATQEAPTPDTHFDLMLSLVEQHPYLTPAQKAGDMRRMRLHRDTQQLLQHERTKEPEALLAFIGEAEKRWEGEMSEAKVSLFALMASSLARNGGENMVARRQGMRLAEFVLEHASDVSCLASDIALMELAARIQGAATSGRAWLDYLDRDKVLNAYLNLQQRVDSYATIPFTNHVAELEQRVSPNAYNIFLRPTAEQVESFNRGIANYHRYEAEETQWKHLVSTNRGPARTNQLPHEIARFIQTRYSDSVDDLRAVETAFASNIRDPALKARLVLLAYKGRPPSWYSADRTDSSSTSRGFWKSSARQQAPALHTGGSPSAETHGNMHGAILGHEQAAPITNRNALRAILLSCLALILFVLWRAQARGNPGRGK